MQRVPLSRPTGLLLSCPEALVLDLFKNAANQQTELPSCIPDVCPK